jgi:hypothetical protein
LIAALLATLTVTAIGFAYLQNEINSLKPQTPNPTPENNPTAFPPLSTATPVPTASSSAPFDYTVFEWTLNPENINNVEWLSSFAYYNTNLNWRENYIYLLSKGAAFPAQMHDSLAAASFTVNAFISVDYDAQTGKTKATYTYYEQDGVPFLYTIETAYPNLKAGSTGWTEKFV